MHPNKSYGLVYVVNQMMCGKNRKSEQNWEQIFGHASELLIFSQKLCVVVWHEKTGKKHNGDY